MISADDLKNEQSVNLSDQELEGVAGGKKCAKLFFLQTMRRLGVF